MPKIIKQITKEQEEQIPKFIQKWVDKASCPIDRPKSLKILQELFADKKPLIFFTESFDNTVYLINFILAEFVKDKKLKLDSQLDRQLYSQLGSQLDSQLDSQLGSELDSELRSQLRSQLDSELDSELHRQLHRQLYSQLDSHISWNYYISIFWYSWAGWYDYGKYIGVEFDEEKLNKFNDIIENVPFAVFVGNLILVCEKPITLWDNLGRIHSEVKTAISWADNTGYHYLHGVKFEKDLWQKVITGRMTFSEILKIENSEQRLQAMRYNPHALMLENPKLLSKTDRDNELYVIENSEANKIYEEPKIFILRFRDPSKLAPNNWMIQESDPELCKLVIANYKDKEIADVVQAFHLYQKDDSTVSKERVEAFAELYKYLTVEG